MTICNMKSFTGFMFLQFLVISTLGCLTPRIGVAEGEGFVSKSFWYSADMKTISQIKETSLCSKSDNDIAVFGRGSLHIIDTESLSAKRKIDFKGRNIIKPGLIVRDCSTIEIIDFGGGFSDVRVLDEKGDPIWIYQPPDTQIYDMSVGDLNQDGEQEFYVATWNGLHQLNSKGIRTWQIGEKAWDAVVIDVENNKESLVATRLDDGHIEFRNYEGKLVRKVKPEVRIYDLESCNWPSPGHFLTKNDNNIYVIDANGKVVFHYELDNYPVDIRGTKVKLIKNEADYLAVVARLKREYNRSIFCIFSPDGKLVYKETLNKTTGLAAVHLPSTSDTEVLLVGDGPGKVYKYQVNEPRLR